ncbi:hypothetical protein [Cellulomonas sp. A375-1]|uniref:hypothetical protein n=1 Tax=Cellulomonas sp. A375-1 TaxID=1672219 RepID=UPI000AA923BD|nr:hypothetical protein [Cellulomonas sp. A375-1]
MVRKAGTYGGASKRQLYACVAPDGSRHRFAPALPREHNHEGVCESCDSTLVAHTGPVVGRDYLHRLRLVAEALVQVGSGVSYVRASNRARVGAGRDPLTGSGAGHLAAEWTDAWSPVIVGALTETDWPETLVLDSTDFWWTNARTKGRRREFAVLIAYGYPGPGAADPRPRVWGIHASHTAQADDWVALLTNLRLPAPPTSVVSDDNLAVTAAIRRVWPLQPGQTLPVPFVFSCEHHLRTNAVAALTADRVAHFGSVRMEALNGAFRDRAGWDAFTATITAKQTNATAWLAGLRSRLEVQTVVRASLPEHYTTAGAEAAAASLKSMLEQRSFSLRNKDRTNRLLGLMRLHLAGRDDPGQYHRILRAHAEAAGGRGAPQGQNRDRRGAASLR